MEELKDHIRADSLESCFICKKLTPFIQIDFETRLCLGTCTDKMWEGYENALQTRTTHIETSEEF